MLSAADLHPYQRTASEWAQSRPGSALWLDMGLGKTAATIDALGSLFETFETGRALVIAPKRVALRTWPKELRSWEQGAGMPFRVLGDKSAAKTVGGDIAAKFGGSSMVDIVSRDNVAALVDLAKAEKRWPYDTVVIDEASSFKSSSAKRFRALKSVSRLTNRFIELTGTPAPNGYLGLWSQMYLLDRGERLGKTVTGFRERWFRGIQVGTNRNAMQYVIREGAKEEIDALLADICLSMSSEDYLDLPPMIETTIPVDLTTKQRGQYAELEAEFLLELEADDTVAVFSAAALSGKLRQFCNGALYREDRTWADIHDAKLDALESVLEEAGGPILVGYQFKFDVARIKARFPFARTIDEDGALDDFEAGKVQLMLAHPASAGHGLNEFIERTERLVFFGLPWGLEEFLQFRKRIHRQGRTKPAFVDYIVVDGTIEDRQVRVMADKNATQDGLLAAVRADVRVRAR